MANNWATKSKKTTPPTRTKEEVIEAAAKLRDAGVAGVTPAISDMLATVRANQK